MNPVARDTLVDFFHDLARATGEFLVYDDGFRIHRYSYAQVGRAACGFAVRLADAGVLMAERRSVSFMQKGEGSMAIVAMTQKDAIVDQLEQLHQRIARRAYDLFRGRDGWGDASGDWLSAETELVWTPAVELCEKDGTFTIAAALPGVDAKDITVDITPQDVVIQAVTRHKHTEDKGQVHRCEFTAGDVFRSLTFPKAVDTAKAKAEYQNGMLNITAPIAPETRAKRVDVTSA